MARRCVVRAGSIADLAGVRRHHQRHDGCRAERNVLGTTKKHVDETAHKRRIQAVLVGARGGGVGMERQTVRLKEQYRDPNVSAL